MDSDIFACCIHCIHIFIGKSADLFRVERTVTVYKIYTIYICLCQHLQCSIQICLLRIGDRHDIAGNLVSFFLCILDHMDRCRHCIDVCCHTYHIDHAVFSINDIFFVIAAAYICHDRNFQIRVVISHDRTDIVFITEFPLAEFIDIEHILRCLIAEFHIVNARFYICTIQFIYKLIRKIKAVHQSSVSDCCI